MDTENKPDEAYSLETAAATYNRVERFYRQLKASLELNHITLMCARIFQ